MRCKYNPLLFPENYNLRINCRIINTGTKGQKLLFMTFIKLSALEVSVGLYFEILAKNFVSSKYTKVESSSNLLN